MESSKLCVNIFPKEYEVKKELESPTKQFPIPFPADFPLTPSPPTNNKEKTTIPTPSSVTSSATASRSDNAKKFRKTKPGFRGKCKNCMKKDVQIQKLMAFKELVGKKATTLRMNSMDIKSFLFDQRQIMDHVGTMVKRQETISGELCVEATEEGPTKEIIFLD